MSTRIPITCHCGNRIQPRDVLQQGRFLRLYSPSFVYVKYRCSHCKRLGERFVPEDQWERAAPPDTAQDVAREERDRLSSLGPISIDEVVDFHFFMQKRPLSDLLRDLE